MKNKPPDLSSQLSREPSVGVRWSVYSVLISISFSIMLVGLLTAKPLASGNDRSRWCTIWSLVERQTYQIDEITAKPGWGTIDKVFHEGHFYSSKPALLPTMTAGVYRIVKNLFGLDLLEDTATTTRLILFVVNVMPFVLSLLMWCLVLEKYAKKFSTRLVLLAFAGVGTFLTTFSVTLNNHTVGAFSLLCAVYAMVRILDDESEKSAKPRLYILAGFFAAFTCANELPAAIFGVASFVILVRHNWKMTAKFYVPAALLPLVGFFVTTYLSTGGWKPFYMYYGTEKYLFVHEGIPSYWFHPGGIDKGGDSTFQYLWHCLIGHHGIFSLTPIFLFSLLGWTGVRKQRSGELTTGMQTMLWLGAGMTVIVIAFYLTRTANYNYGGMTSGLRWTFWLIPLWILAAIPACDAFSKRVFFWPVVLCFMVVSMYSSLSPIQKPWQHPWLFQWMASRGMINYSDPAPTVDFKRQTWLQTLPEVGKTEWIEFSEELIGGENRTIRLTGQGEKESVRLTIKRSDEEREYIVQVNREAFEAGKTLSEIFTFSDEVDAKDKKWIVNWFSGVPKENAFRVRDHRYLKTELRPEAFRCLRATSYVTFKETEKSESRRYYCMAWWTEDVPFGIVRVRQSVSAGNGRTALSQRILRVTAASRIDEFTNPFAAALPDE